MNVTHAHPNRTATPASEPSRHRPGPFVDVHCHCLPGLDDGPASGRQALTLCRLLAQDHISIVVATPHQLGRFTGRTRPDAVRCATRQLNHELADEGIRLRIAPGAEVRLDERVSTLLAEDAILTLADRRQHLLLELPEQAFIDIEPLIAGLVSQGTDVIIAHPERNGPLLGHPRVLWRWLNRGVTLQITAGSLAGHFGRTAERNAWWLLAEGWVALIATDAHDCEAAGPCMTTAFEMIRSRLGEPVARLLCSDNPLRVVKGERIRPPIFHQKQEVR